MLILHQSLKAKSEKSRWIWKLFSLELKLTALNKQQSDVLI